MPWSSFLVVFAICESTMLVYRVVPMLALAGRELPVWLARMLDYIPVCAFAALVANDLFKPEALSQGPWQVLLPYLAALPVVLVARRTRSLALCIVVGVGAYALLMLVGGLLV
ncbi:MAG: AzlD domain-containing protein [Coriobacteriales bacterium]